MKKFLKYCSAVLLAMMILDLTAWAGQIITFSNGDTISASSLNSNFQHIHNLMVGGHGARLVDADVSASAAIAQSKIAGLGATSVKAWGVFSTNCGLVCTETIQASYGISSISNTSLGNWTVTLSSTRADVAYAVIATANEATFLCNASYALHTTSTFAVHCLIASSGASTNTPFQITILDNT